jgi:hypothetical protein
MLPAVADRDPIHVALVKAGMPWPAPDGDRPEHEWDAWCDRLSAASKLAALDLEDQGVVSGPLWHESGARIVLTYFLGCWWPLAEQWEASQTRAAGLS